MNIRQLKKGCFLAVICYFVLAALLWAIAHEQFRFRDETTAMVTALDPVGELVQGVEVRQPFSANGDEIRSVSLLLSTYDRMNSSHLTVQIEDESGTVLGSRVINAEEIADNSVWNIAFNPAISVERDQRCYLVLFSEDAMPGNAVTAWWGNTVSAARTEVALNVPEDEQVRVNGVAAEGKLCCAFQDREYLWFGTVYWPIAVGLGAAFAVFCAILVQRAKLGKSSAVLRLINAFQRYNFLMRQLIGRDFKTKYKRSILGVFWSFLNPLLTMTVQYIVFSTLFRSDIPNFPLYLLSGIVCFNFFNEASSMSLMSIVGNAPLITKVYVPKYIYPLSRVLSSSVNLMLSMIPLFAVMLLTGAPVRPALLLLPFGLICLMALSLGIGLFLSTTMVFFRDTQFLWGVVSMLWMYATPIFYPESIIGEQFMTLYKCNPLYHIIRFIRIVLIDGISPEPKAYALCLIASFVPLVIGAVVFKKNQDKFILNL